MKLFSDAYRGRRVLITGHTGFKGSWLALWLRELGAEVAGIALDAIQPSHWHLLALDTADHRQDIRDAARVRVLVESVRPDIVFHLAAQALVRRSYRDPLENWSTNVMGTANVLEACRHAASVRAIIAVTTDKVYANRDDGREYREADRLGGHDPYSASKAACELLVESYRCAFFGNGGPLLASARGGNVIGGGDWSEDRLVADAARAIAAGKRLLIRSPNATRPWQHVLECLAGYLLLGEKLLEGRHEHASAWNFGPDTTDNRTVAEVLELLRRYWPELSWEQSSEPQPREARLLSLDHGKATALLGWRPVWGLDRALEATGAWYRHFLARGVANSRAQLAAYVDSARAAGATWVRA
ncbi:MAG TPA: CDP-glucose 4,6-dehydratase [Burkholderiales bacterium]|nr:CDP-glucose 4,6-dehydratase [Burkholderiales bacterium]